ncbi:MAG: Phosphoribosylformylglycinamidine synthase subunit I [Candidatus Roizmanbacteria bacterium GW2011_GWA2_37_7]|uniref:Phosphoribosylformylglycinamidine synthase subunit I n=1 Tax=Candidatus Roizmanbacteria bacterium GW2011_GWA2_37_7 TaxID=1618481 RepID=A0A0G0HGX6_9BACT|nr:MAG: Phosphoribosylformylglycinamidine synthase subunit I [Candidatus Roizmanbacteria bacterium GW2011_GWA2_37_7]
MKPKALIMSGYGLNCEEETKYAFDKAGAVGDIVHINDLIDREKNLSDYQILALPGGFSYGDDTGSGNAFANKIKNHLWEKIQSFVQKDHLVIGICNGFQILANLGIFPVQFALTHNDSARYTVRWVDLKVENNSPWLQGIHTLSLPIAHGEGKLFADNNTLSRLNKKNMVALRYVEGEICRYQTLTPNPNGSIEDIAGITDKSGKIFGLMPHPERALFFTNLPHWPYLKEKYRREKKAVPEIGPGLSLFKNAVHYFS